MLHIYAIPEKTLQKHFEGNHSVKSSKNKTQTTRTTALITLCPLDAPHVIAVPTET
jgi:hypothetical protein